MLEGRAQWYAGIATLYGCSIVYIEGILSDNYPCCHQRELQVRPPQAREGIQHVNCEQSMEDICLPMLLSLRREDGALSDLSMHSSNTLF